MNRECQLDGPISKALALQTQDLSLTARIHVKRANPTTLEGQMETLVHKTKLKVDSTRGGIKLEVFFFDYNMQVHTS